MERKKRVRLNNSRNRSLKQQHDRISELPEPLLHHILSLLPADEAIATAVLSKAWKAVWITIPCLDLGESLFLKKKSQKLENQFLNFVDQTLTTRKPSESSSSVQRLNLYVPDRTPETRAHFDRWITQAFHNYQLEELTVNSSYSLKLPSNVFVRAHRSLKRLSLTRVEFTPHMMSEWLANSCPFIESLCLDGCILPRSSIKVSALSKLAEFVIRDDKYLKHIEIRAPKLLLFEWHHSSNSKVHVINLAECDKLQCLRLRSYGVVLLECSDPGVFSNLESLHLRSPIKLKTRFVISSNRLRSLFIGHWTTCSSYFLEFDAPNLKEFTYATSTTSSFGLKFSSLKKASFCLDVQYKLHEFLKELQPRDDLEIRTDNCNELVKIPLSVQRETSGLLSNVKHLVLTLKRGRCPSWSIIKDSITDTIDNLLWLCPHPQSISLALCRKSKVEEMKVLKFKHKEDKTGTNDHGCCNFLPNPCWQHRLEEVRIENSKGNHAKMKNYRGRHKARANIDDQIKAFLQNKSEGKIIVDIINLR